ncbi:H-NS family nucleoid-associated regulatory protein [Burkholderia stabilis]|uniref:H-NS family nucleoid-associated regulatory protein n=1 Tax=Burkholderia stabilis TaxID=95485 RepID=UPI00240A4265|nr:H-NS family nucleoid-associated regulatory protein [Burkholderia stabilis]
MLGDPLKDLLEKRVKLDAEIAMHRLAHRPDIIKKIVHLMQEYSIRWKDIELFLRDEKIVSASRKRHLAPQFRDPETGATWAGRGRLPRWMRGRNPEEFRIKADGLGSSLLKNEDVMSSCGKLFVPLYWNPETGATWSGRGRRPLWMKGRNPGEFRIKSSGMVGVESIEDIDEKD